MSWDVEITGETLRIVRQVGAITSKHGGLRREYLFALCPHSARSRDALLATLLSTAFRVRRRSVLRRVAFTLHSPMTRRRIGCSTRSVL